MKKLGLILLSSTTIYGASFDEKIYSFNALAEKKQHFELAEFNLENYSQPFTGDLTTLPHSLENNLRPLENSQQLPGNKQPINLNPKTSTQPFSSEQLVMPTPKVALKRKNAFLAATLSGIIPGLGHVYLGDMRMAGNLFGSTAAAFGSIAIPNVPDQLKTFNVITGGNTIRYGVYAAFRDARALNGHSTYHYKMPRESFKELAWAPFSFSVLKKPEVWGGLLGGLGLAAGVVHFSSPANAVTKVSLSTDHSLLPLVAFPVGIGEEAFFRGYLQSQLCEWMQPSAGITLTSFIFGAAHIANTMNMSEEETRRYFTFSLPLITALGGYFGWMTHKNCSLKESVAMHAWYDFAIFATHAAVDRAAATSIPATFSFSTSF